MAQVVGLALVPVRELALGQVLGRVLAPVLVPVWELALEQVLVPAREPELELVSERNRPRPE